SNGSITPPSSSHRRWQPSCQSRPSGAHAANVCTKPPWGLRHNVTRHNRCVVIVTTHGTPT
ncbi:MAG: hypothetical protein VKK63_11340, partial [Synechococcus sp.]|nr:hypothetical protein [Synechococcus sp.]